MEFNPNDMHKLAELLRPPAEEEVASASQTSADDLPKTGYETASLRQKRNPSDSGQAAGARTEEEFESEQARELDESPLASGRREPLYTMVYQQAVSAEDVYLQMGLKTPGSASCERLIVRVRLPGDKRESVELDVQRRLVRVRTARHALTLPLPHAADPDASRASWDPADHTLELSLKLERELDFVNF